MPRKKILWLCSWYPGRVEPFNGDFIQRHAHAAALYNEIYVLHVYGDRSGVIRKTATEEIHHDHLTEHLVYFSKGNTWAGRWMAGYRWLYLYRKAIRNYMRDHGKPDLVHVHVPMKAGLFALWMKKRYRVPFVVTEHWGIYNDIDPGNFSRRSKTFQNFTRKIFLQSESFTSVSRFLAEGIGRLVVKKDWMLIPNVVNTGVFQYVKSEKKGVFRFIHVSNMVPLKNPEGILRAFRQFLKTRQDAELVMVGDKDPSIRMLSNELELNEFVRFTGEIPYTGVAAEMKQSDCLVLFSNIENSPCVIGEALCCGLPVIATRVGGIPELVNDANGILIPPRDEEALSSAMLQMSAELPNYDRESIAGMAKTKFSFPVIGKQFDELYDRTVKT